MSVCDGLSQSVVLSLLQEDFMLRIACLLAFVCLFALVGCDAKSIGEGLTGGIADFTAGLESGAKEGSAARNASISDSTDVRGSEAFTKAGFEATTVDPSISNVKVYVISKNEVKDGMLVLKAFDASDKEVGRDKVKAKFDKDDAHMVSFKLEGNLSKIAYYVVDYIAD